MCFYRVWRNAVYGRLAVSLNVCVNPPAQKQIQADDKNAGDREVLGFHGSAKAENECAKDGDPDDAQAEPLCEI